MGWHVFLPLLTAMATLRPVAVHEPAPFVAVARKTGGRALGDDHLEAEVRALLGGQVNRRPDQGIAPRIRGPFDLLRLGRRIFHVCGQINLQAGGGGKGERAKGEPGERDCPTALTDSVMLVRAEVPELVTLTLT